MATLEDTITSFVSPGPDRTLAGVTLMAATPTGEVYNKSFGTRTIDASSPALGPTDIMALQSCTKLVTAIAALQCVERGLLTIDADAAELLPELKGIQVVKGVKEDGYPILEEATEKITLRRLLTHTAGFSYAGIFPMIRKWQEVEGLDPDTSWGKIPNLNTMPLMHEPGHGWCYGVSYEWAGLLIEKATGMGLLQYFQRNIFDPLGIKDMCMNLERRPDLKARFVQRTLKTEKGLESGNPPWPLDAPSECGGAGLFGSAEEYFVVLRAVMAGDQRLLKKETYELLYKVEVRDAEGPMVPNMVYANFDKEAPVPEGKIKWGHSLAAGVLLTDVPGWSREGSLRWGGMYNHAWCIDQKSQIVTLMATQYEPYDGPDVVKASAMFHAEMLKRFGKA